MMTADAKQTVPRLGVESVTKRFPGVLALDHVSLGVMAGETLAVIGENGAGKSTLMKILAGIQVPDSGNMFLNGNPVHFSSASKAMAAGVSLIHQELNLHNQLSIAENIFLGREPNHYGWIDRKSMESKTEEVLKRVGLSLSPRTLVGSLSTATCQMIEVAKAISTNASVIIMDEPTSSLSVREAERLFEIVDTLKAETISVVYISHRLGEVVRLADRVEVLRDGRNAGELNRDAIDFKSQINHDAMVSKMVGRDVNRLFDRRQITIGDPVLKVSDFCSDFPNAKPVSFEIRSGEIVGIAGLMGSGRSELLESIFGIRTASQGSVCIEGNPIRLGNVRAAIASGIALVPEDRKHTGLLVESSVQTNATLVAMTEARSAPWLKRSWQREVTSQLIEKLHVKTSSQSTVIANLSGGNQQKIALGKWLIDQPKVQLLDEPTRGVDVGAKEEIYRFLENLAEQGMAILFVSSEMEEILAIADRVMVMHEGEITGILNRNEANEDVIMEYAVGLKSQR